MKTKQAKELIFWVKVIAITLAAMQLHLLIISIKL